MANKRKRKADPTQVARFIVETVTGESLSADAKPKAAEPAQPEKDPAAVALGRRGGLKGGPARAAKMTKKQRSESAKKAAMARWKKTK